MIPEPLYLPIATDIFLSYILAQGKNMKIKSNINFDNKTPIHGLHVSASACLKLLP